MYNVIVSITVIFDATLFFMKAETGINAFFTSGVPSLLNIERLSIEVTSFTQDIAKLDWTMDWTWKKQILETKQVMTLTMFLRKNKKKCAEYASSTTFNEKSKNYVRFSKL